MMRKFSPHELSGETRAAIRAFWRAAYNGRVDVRRLYVEAQSMVEAEWFNPELRKEFEMDAEMTPPTPQRGEETKVCSHCKEEKPIGEFVSRYNKPAKMCKACRKYYRQKRREQIGEDPEPEPTPAPPVPAAVAHQNGTTAIVKRLPAQLPTPSMVRLSFGQAEKLLNLVIGETRIDEDGIRIEAAALARFLPALLDGLIPDEADDE